MKPVDLARRHGRDAYESGVCDASAYLEAPPYPDGPELVAFWQGWSAAQTEYREWAEAMSEPADDTHDPTFGL